MKVAEFVKYGFNNTSFTVMNKASNIALSVSLFINFHKLRCPIVYNYRNLFNFDVLKVLKDMVNNQEPAGPAGDGELEVVSTRCLMTLSGVLLRPIGNGPPCFSFIRYILVLCL